MTHNRSAFVATSPARFPFDPRWSAPNRDIDRRDQILGITSDPNPHEVTPFHGVRADQLAALVREGFAPPGGRQNRGPSTEEFLSFMEQWPEVMAFGYAVHPTREDYRITIEGVACDLLMVDAQRRDALRTAFTQRFRSADELVDALQCLYAFWD